MSNGQEALSMMRRLWLTVAVVAGSLIFDARSAVRAQDPTAKFRSETTVIEVDAHVFDGQGHFVGDLTASDFELYEDGKLQPLTDVELVDIPPVSGAQRTTVSSDVSSNKRTATPGRYYLLVLDDLHTAVLRSQTMKAVVRRFIESTVEPNDRAAIVVTSGRTGPSHDFTSNQKSLLAAIDQFVGQKATTSNGLMSRLGRPEGSAPGRSAPADPLRPPRSPGESPDDEEGRTAETMVRSLRDWVNYLSGLSGQTKSLVWFSEGIGYDTFNPFNRYALSIEDLLRETIAAATRNNVTIYAVDPRGLATGQKSEIKAFLGPDEDYFSDESFRMKASLSHLAGGTGGFAFTSSNDYGSAFQRIADEARRYYLLRYAPAVAGTDVRQIQVKVRRPDVKVQSRRQVSFRPSQSDTADSRDRIARVLGSALPQTGLPMAVASSAWRRQGKLVDVIVTVGVDASSVWSGDSSPARSAVFLLAAIDRAGHVKASRTVSLTDIPVDAREFRMASELELAPGEYQLRVAAVADADGKAGSVHHDLTVPNLNARPVAAGDPMITARSVIGSSRVFADIPGPRPEALPATQRSFRLDDELRVSGQVFLNDKGTSGTATAILSLSAGDGTVCSHADGPVRPGANGDSSYALPLPLLSCKPGHHVLLVELQDATGRAGAWKRSIPIELLPPAN